MIIYRVTNQKNGKIYIGQTRQSLEDRRADHLRKAFTHSSQSHFHAALRKHGKDVFSWEAIETVETLQILNEREAFWINHYQSSNPDVGYNLTLGGGQIVFHESVCQRISKNVSGSRNGNFGKPKSAETKAKMSAAQKGRKKTPEQIEKMRVVATGKKMSQETIEKMRLAHTGRKRTKEEIEKSRLSRIGLKMSETAKKNMSLAALGKHRGQNNFNTKINEEIARKIKSDLSNGVRSCEIQKKYAVTKSIVQSIKRGTTWRYVLA